MIPHLKLGSPLIVGGNFEPPEIYNDREGKPQASMNITASYLQFSPFGRPDREEKAASPQPASFAAPAEAAPKMENASFDDEVPF